MKIERKAIGEGFLSSLTVPSQFTGKNPATQRRKPYQHEPSDDKPWICISNSRLSYN